MKKISLSLLLSATLIYGVNTSHTPIPQARSQTQSMLIQKLQRYFAQGAYRTVCNSAKHAVGSYSNPTLHLLWAKSAAALGEWEEAMSAYERVLILNPSNTEAQKGLRAIYKSTGRETLLTYQEGEPLREPTLQAKLGLSMGYDDNLNASAGEDALDDYYGISGSDAERSSLFGKVTATFDYHYAPSVSSPWYTSASLDIDSQHNPDAHLYDMFSGMATVGLGYKTEKYQLYFPLSYTYIDYLDTHLIDRYHISPSLFIAIDETDHIGIQGIYYKTVFKDTAYSNRDSDTFGASVAYYHLLSSTTLFKTYLKYTSKKKKNSNTARYVDATYTSLGSKIQHRFSQKFLLQTDVLYRFANYRDDIGTATIPSAQEREDNLLQADIKLEYLYQDNLTLYLQNTYTTVESNSIPAVYQKNQVMFGVTAHY